MFLAALLAAAVAAQPIGDQAALITADDYPAAARRAGKEGVVAVTLAIDASGYVADCTVTTSSGSPDLDAATCALLRERARYSPELDEQGRVIATVRSRKVRWTLPPLDELASGAHRMTYAIDTAGQLGTCKLDEIGAPDPNAGCNPELASNMASAYLTKPLTQYSSVSVTLAMEVDTDKKALPMVGSERIMISKASIGVSADGVITGCTMVESSPFQGQTLDLCNAEVAVGDKRFAPDRSGRAHSVTVSLELAATPR